MLRTCFVLLLVSPVLLAAAAARAAPAVASEESTMRGGACGPRIEARGWVHTESYHDANAPEGRARHLAILRWHDKVHSAMGPGYARWRIALGKDVTCYKAGYKLHCEVSAMPCQSATLRALRRRNA